MITADTIHGHADSIIPRRPTDGDSHGCETNRANHETRTREVWIMDYERRLRAYVDRAFAGTTETTPVRQAKTELTADLVDKYRTLVAQGQSLPVAYESTIAGVGDVFELVDQVGGASWTPPTQTFATVRPRMAEYRRLLTGGLAAPWYPAFVIACWALALLAFVFVASKPHLRGYLLLVPVIAAVVHGLVHSIAAYSEAPCDV